MLTYREVHSKPEFQPLGASALRLQDLQRTRRPPAHLPLAHARLRAHTPVVLLFGHLVSLANRREVSFPGSSAPFGRGSDSSSTASKQPSFRGSKYFATCYFSVIYYEHIFPFIRGFANSPESQNLATASCSVAAPLLLVSPAALGSSKPAGAVQGGGGVAGARDYPLLI